MNWLHLDKGWALGADKQAHAWRLDEQARRADPHPYSRKPHEHSVTCGSVSGCMHVAA